MSFMAIAPDSVAFKALISTELMYLRRFKISPSPKGFTQFIPTYHVLWKNSLLDTLSKTDTGSCVSECKNLNICDLTYEK